MSERSDPAPRASSQRRIATCHSKISFLKSRKGRELSQAKDIVTTNRTSNHKEAMRPIETPPPSKEARPYLKGSCFCQKIRFNTLSPPTSISFCHCITCRKLSSNPFIAFGTFHNEAVHLTAQDANSIAQNIILKEYSDIAKRGFCRECKSQLFMKYHCKPDETHLCLGLLDDEPFMTRDMYTQDQWRSIPKEHIFLRTAMMSTLWGLGGLPLDDGVPDELRHPDFDESFAARLQDWERKGKPRRDDVRMGPF